MEEQNNIIQLQDEDGNDVNFQHLMTIEHEGGYYIVLEAVEDMEDCMEGEAIILKIIKDEDGQDMYATIDDEAELQAVFDKCVAALEEAEDDGENELDIEFGEYESDENDEGEEDGEK